MEDVRRKLFETGHANSEGSFVSRESFTQTVNKTPGGLGDGLSLGHGPLLLPAKHLRKTRRAPEPDAAGLLSYGCWQGKPFPRKGHGTPPPEGYEAELPKTSLKHPSYSHRLSFRERDPIGVYGYNGLRDDGYFKSPHRRKHLGEQRNRGSLVGAVLKDDGVERVSRRKPQPPLISTSDRVLGTNEGLTEEDINSTTAKSHRNAYGALRRPMTSPSAYHQPTVASVLAEVNSACNMRAVPQPQPAEYMAAFREARSSAEANRARSSRPSFVLG